MEYGELTTCIHHIFACANRPTIITVLHHVRGALVSMRVFMRFVMKSKCQLGVWAAEGFEGKLSKIEERLAMLTSQ
jgi:hypothetical protein